MTMIHYILLVSIIAGLIVNYPHFGFRTLIYFIVALSGGFLGLFLSFGDDPFLMKYSFILNERSVPIIAAVACVFIVLFFEQKQKRSKVSKR